MPVNINLEKFLIEYATQGTPASTIIADLNAYAAALDRVNAALAKGGGGSGAGGGLPGTGTGGGTTSGTMAGGGPGQSPPPPPAPAYAANAQPPPSGTPLWSQSQGTGRYPGQPIPLTPSRSPYDTTVLSGNPVQQLNPNVTVPFAVDTQKLASSPADKLKDAVDTFWKNLTTTLTDPLVWGRHIGWLVQSAVLYQVTGLVSAVFEGIGAAVKLSLASSDTITRTSVATGQNVSVSRGNVMDAMSTLATGGISPQAGLPAIPGMTALANGMLGGNQRGLASAAALANRFYMGGPTETAPLLARNAALYNLSPEQVVALTVAANANTGGNPLEMMAGAAGLGGMAAIGNASYAQVSSTIGMTAALTGRGGNQSANMITQLQQAGASGQGRNILTAMGIPSIRNVDGNAAPMTGLEILSAIQTRWPQLNQGQQGQLVAGLGLQEQRRDFETIFGNAGKYADALERATHSTEAFGNALSATSSDLGFQVSRLTANLSMGVGTALDPTSRGFGIQLDVINKLMESQGGKGIQSVMPGVLGSLIPALNPNAGSNTQGLLNMLDSHGLLPKGLSSLAGGGSANGTPEGTAQLFQNVQGTKTIGEFSLLQQYTKIAEEQMKKANIPLDQPSVQDFMIRGGGGGYEFKQLTGDTRAIRIATELVAQRIVGIFNIPQGNELQFMGLALANPAVQMGGRAGAGSVAGKSSTLSGYQDYRAGERAGYPGATSGQGQLQSLSDSIASGLNSAGDALIGAIQKLAQSILESFQSPNLNFPFGINGNFYQHGMTSGGIVSPGNGSAYQEYRQGERADYGASSVPIVLNLDGNKVGKGMAGYDQASTDAMLKSGYSGGTGNAPMLGSPII